MRICFKMNLETKEQMREIKFRGYCKDRKVWIHFTLSDLDMGLLSIPFDELDIIVQFTGRKDKNGKEIFEGDIVIFNYFIEGEMNKSKMVIRFEESMFEAYGKKGLPSGEFISGSMNKFEVIGNLYENPELLEETK